MAVATQGGGGKPGVCFSTKPPAYSIQSRKSEYNQIHDETLFWVENVKPITKNERTTTLSVRRRLLCARTQNPNDA